MNYCDNGHTTDYVMENGEMRVAVYNDSGVIIARVNSMLEHEIEEMTELLESGECPICDRWGKLKIIQN